MIETGLSLVLLGLLISVVFACGVVFGVLIASEAG
jgi:hypothetical protein